MRPSVRGLRLAGHRLSLYTSTIKRDGEHRTTGGCTCGWGYEGTFYAEVREQYRRHLTELSRKDGVQLTA